MTVTAPNEWFSVSKEGLGRLIRDPSRVLLELWQNAVDENVTEIRMSVENSSKPGLAYVRVTDDSPDGFRDLSHAYTLFADSGKKGDPTKRGRFNLGEKLVLALCVGAAITSTKGEVIFDAKGRHETSSKRAVGTTFSAMMRLSPQDCEKAIQQLMSVIPPDGVKTWLNGILIEPKPAFRRFRTGLETDIADDQGNLRRSWRETEVSLHNAPYTEKNWLFEMGVPVVEIETPWHINVAQKVPLNMDRDNVRPAFLQRLLVAVLNETTDLITQEDSWVPLGSPHASDEAIRATIRARFGERSVAFDPSDREANSLAAAAGYTVVHGGTLTRSEWANVKKAGALLPAGRVMPSPKAELGSLFEGENPYVPASKWTDGMRRVAVYTSLVGHALLGREITVNFVNDFAKHFAACFTERGTDFTYNVGRLGYKWFDVPGPNVEIDALILHELGHHYAGDHLSPAFADAIAKLGAQFRRAGEFPF